jgi:hypothetical protein
MKTIKLTILENALHSLERSILHARDSQKDIREWKFGILLLIQTIELIFKELLFRSHPVLIYENIDTRKNTVSLMLAKKRLQEIGGITLSESDSCAIKTAANWRNQLMHYEFNVDSHHAHQVYYQLIAFLMEFYENHFDQPLRETISDDLWNQVIQIEEFVKDAMERIQQKINRNNIDSTLVWNCRNCGQDAFVVQDDENTCYLCGYFDQVIICDDCGDLDYHDTMHELYVGNYKGLDATNVVCERCYEKHCFPYDEDY